MSDIPEPAARTRRRPTTGRGATAEPADARRSPTPVDPGTSAAASAPTQRASPSRRVAPAGRAPLTDLSLVERLGVALGLAWAGAALLATSPVADHLPDLGTLLPDRYVDLLSLIPAATNTTLVFLLLFAASALSLFMSRHPVVPLSGVVAVLVGLAAYPYGAILWHRVFLRGVEATRPGPLAWLLGMLVMVLLLAQPVTSQARRLLARYEEKGLERHELVRLRRAIIETVLQRAAIGVAFTLGLMLVLIVIPAAGTPQRWLLDHSVLVLLVAAFLLIGALALGAGIFDRENEA